MGTKTISLSEEAYRLLKEAKLPGESFSDVVKRMIKKKPLSSFAGLWAELEDEKIEEIKKIVKIEREISDKKWGY